MYVCVYNISIDTYVPVWGLKRIPVTNSAVRKSIFKGKDGTGNVTLRPMERHHAPGGARQRQDESYNGENDATVLYVYRRAIY